MKATAKASTGKKTSSAKTSKKSNLDAKNAKDIAYRISHEKDLKYIYPAETEAGKNKKEVLSKRKQYRAKVRRQTSSLEKALKMARKSKDADQIRKAERQLSKHMKAHYANA